jgi:tRNA C32,U32 (ribose-2'-O)-methylase TrmJ
MEAAMDLPADLATLEERERLVQTYHPLLETLGVMLPQHHASQVRRLRQMLLRWRVTSTDTRLLMGVAREMKRMLRREPEA